jgi:hypothetical protein
MSRIKAEIDDFLKHIPFNERRYTKYWINLENIIESWENLEKYINKSAENCEEETK